MDGLSIRKYAEAHQLNRGSVDYQQKKFFSALASLLKERDEAEGTWVVSTVFRTLVCRLWDE